MFHGLILWQNNNYEHKLQTNEQPTKWIIWIEKKVYFGKKLHFLKIHKKNMMKDT